MDFYHRRQSDKLCDHRLDAGAYVEELRRFLDGSELLERRAFIKGFIKEVNVKGNEGLIKYALPLPPDNIKEENLKVLPIVQYSGQ